MKKLILSLFVVFFVLLSCDNPANSGDEDTIQIKNVGYMISNEDYSFSGVSSGSHAWIKFWIELEANSLVASDISSVKIIFPSGSNYISDTASGIQKEYDPVDNSFYYSLRLTDALLYNAIDIGNYKFEVQYSNDKKAEYTLLVAAPGKTTAEGFDYCYTEDWNSSGSNYTPLPKRATISKAMGDKSAKTLEIDFSVTDDIIYNGYVLFYDSGDEYVGGTGWFRDFSNGDIDNILNGGASFKTDGTTNKITLENDDISFTDGKSFSDIYYIHIILTDGKQYITDTVKNYRSRSVSAEKSVTFS